MLWNVQTIRWIRQEVLQVTQGEMATYLGVHRVSVSRWETGEREPALRQRRNMRRLLLVAHPLSVGKDSHVYR